jgi:DNA-binding Lrp family transcriptional regulator
MAVTLDSIDMMILRELRNNCRASYRALARRTGLSPNAVKNRVTKLIDAGVIIRFAIRLAVKTTEAEYFLAIVLTDGTESFYDFVSHIGEIPMVYHVSALASIDGGAYLIAGEYSGSSMLAELREFLGQLDEVKDIELHTMLTTDILPGRKTEFSRAQMKVLKCLNQNARMQISEIAEMASMAPKTARRVLREIVAGGGVNFTASFDFAVGGFVDVFVRVKWNEKQISVDEIVQWLSDKFPVEFWAPWISISEFVMFADFVVGDLQAAERISNKIREAPFVISTTTLVNFSAVKFPYFGEMGIKELLDATGV